jgi:hypothetical protein
LIRLNNLKSCDSSDAMMNESGYTPAYPFHWERLIYLK